MLTHVARCLSLVTAARRGVTGSVIADLTGTRFCDSCWPVYLLLAHRQAAPGWRAAEARHPPGRAGRPGHPSHRA